MNKFFSIILSLVLSLPIAVWAVDDINEATSEQVGIEAPVFNTLDEEQDGEISTYKQPISKRKIAKKFLAAMGGVAASSFAIFFLLSAYNRVRDRYVSSVKTIDDENNLETPDDIDSAVKSFLDKTDWS